MISSESSVCCSKSEVELEHTRIFQEVVLDASYEKCLPIAPVDQSTLIEYSIPAKSERYVDAANSQLRVVVKIFKADGTAIDNTDDVALANNCMHTLFDSITLEMNGTTVTSASTDYGLRAYMENLLSFGKEAKDGLLSSIGWKADYHGQMEPHANNTGYQTRKGYTSLSREYDMMGPLHLDMFQQHKYILRGVPLRLVLTRSADRKCLLTPAANNENYKIVFQKCELYLRVATLSESVRLQHEHMLNNSRPAGYGLKRVNLKTFSVPAGKFDHSIDDAGSGELPQSAVIGFLDNESHNGNYHKNPFNFKHFDIRSLALIRNGQQIPTSAYEPIFQPANATRFVREYLSLFEVTGKSQSDEGMDISRAAYGSGYTLFGFNLRPDLSDGETEQPHQKGNLRLEVKFGTALPNAITVVIFLVMDNHVLIYRNGNIVLDFTP